MRSTATPWDVPIYLFLVVFSVFCAVPMLLIVMVSVTDEASIIKFGYSLIPAEFSVEAYKIVFRRGSSVLRSYTVPDSLLSQGRCGSCDHRNGRIHVGQ